MKTTTDPKAAQWYAAQKHANQKYGTQPYSFHLETAVAQLESKILPLPEMRFYDHNVIRCAVWLHDVVEDTKTSIFELGTLFDQNVVELVDAVTDGPGKNRAERKAPMYSKVRAIGLPAVAVKLSDRLANAIACGLTKGTNSMLELYQKEQGKFESELMDRTPSWELYSAWMALRSNLGLSTDCAVELPIA